MDPIANMLIALKNAQAVRKETVLLPYSKIKAEILGVLKTKGYVSEVAIKGRRGGKVMEISLAYDEKGAPAITEAKKISKLSRRTYLPAKKLRRGKAMGARVISTPKGVMSEDEAARQNVGGEIICWVA